MLVSRSSRHAKSHRRPTPSGDVPGRPAWPDHQALPTSTQSTSALPPSALSLLVAGVRADDVHHTAAADDLAILTNSLDAGPDFHNSLGEPFSTKGKAPQYRPGGRTPQGPTAKIFPSWTALCMAARLGKPRKPIWMLHLTHLRQLSPSVILARTACSPLHVCHATPLRWVPRSARKGPSRSGPPCARNGHSAARRPYIASTGPAAHELACHRG